MLRPRAFPQGCHHWPMLPQTHWMAPEQWARRKQGENCGLCADIHLELNEFSFLVAELEWSYVRLARNRYRRGWTLLALKRHACELFELTDSESAGFWREVAAVVRALDHVCQPAKMNYGVFGNLSPQSIAILLHSFFRWPDAAVEHASQGRACSARQLSRCPSRP